MALRFQISWAIAWAIAVAVLVLPVVAHAQMVQPVFPQTAPPPPAPTFLSQVSACCKDCKTGFCNSALGKMLGEALTPISMMTGGVIPAPCNNPQKAAADAAANSPADVPPSMGAAAKIEANIKQAKARVAAVQFLASIDCHWYPEAEAALVASLRADPAECVRLEAARALARGCCCTKVTIEALNICVSGSEKDGNPSENSVRVKAAAWEALSNCMATGKLFRSPSHADPWQGRPEVPPVDPTQPETIKPLPTSPNGTAATSQANFTTARQITASQPPTIRLTSYYERLADRSSQVVVADAREILTAASRPRPAANAASTIRRPRTGGSLMELWRQSAE